MLTLAVAKFASAGLTVGDPQVQKDAEPFREHLDGPEFEPGVISAKEPLLFAPASPTPRRIEVDALLSVNSAVYGTLRSVCDAVAQAWERWQTTAMFTGVAINAAVGVAPPGSLQGTGMEKESLLMPLRARFASAENVLKAKGARKREVSAPSGAPGSIPPRTRMSGEFEFMQAHCEAVCDAVAQAWAAWQKGYTVTLTYPSGAACSTTMPPSPNVPVPLAAGSSPGDAMMGEAMLRTTMLAFYGSGERHPGITAAFMDAVASAVSHTFETWKASTMITNVIGTGGAAPVPPLPPGPVAGAVGTGGRLV